MSYENFTVKRQGDVVVVEVNRPKALNALNSATLDEGLRLFDDLAHEEKLKCVILTGVGSKAFIAGADISEMAGLGETEALEFSRKGQALSLKIETFPAPVIAAVNGFALGGGCEMAISCDFIIASSKAVFGQPEVTLGLITGFGGAVRLSDYVGWPMAREMIFSGRRVNAEEALRLGLVNRVVQPEKLMEEALNVAQNIAKNSPAAVRAVKDAMARIRSQASVHDQLEIEARSFAAGFTTFDMHEGTKAFLEKRKPQFKGE